MNAKPASSRSQQQSRTRNRDKTREALQYAILRVRNSGRRISISAVAAEAGVSPGLVHNTYPDVAEEIRAMMGRSTRQQRDAKGAELTAAKSRMRELRNELAAVQADVAKLASINETLRQELAILRAATGSNVTVLRPRKRPRET